MPNYTEYKRTISKERNLENLRYFVNCKLSQKHQAKISRLQCKQIAIIKGNLVTICKHSASKFLEDVQTSKEFTLSQYVYIIENYAYSCNMTELRRVHKDSLSPQLTDGIYTLIDGMAIKAFTHQGKEVTSYPNIIEHVISTVYDVSVTTDNTFNYTGSIIEFSYNEQSNKLHQNHNFLYPTSLPNSISDIIGRSKQFTISLHNNPMQPIRVDISGKSVWIMPLKRREIVQETSSKKNQKW